MISLINHQGLKVLKGLQLQNPSPSIGLAYIGAYLKLKGFNYTGIDACGEALDQVYPYDEAGEMLVQGLTIPQVLERIPADTKVFGFTCLFSQCWPLVFRLARVIRNEYPRALIVAGGEHPTALPESVLHSHVFDCVVYGEGEETFHELVSRSYAEEDWRDIAGVIYAEPNGRLIKNTPRKRVSDIDAFPIPDWENWPLEQYIQHNQVTGINLGRSMPILGSRGCPYACTFCSNEDMWTRRYIMRRGDLIVDEMALRQQRYNVTGFTFMDSTFIINRRKVMDFALNLEVRNLGVVYQIPAGTRCEAIDQELVFALERSGLRNFALAPESGSDEILQVIKKQMDLTKLIETARYVIKSKITLGIFIVIGFPEDTKHTLASTLKLIRKLALLGAHDVTVSKFTPYPGSPYFRKLLDEGMVSSDYQNSPQMINFFDSESRSYCPNFSDKQLHCYMLWFFINFYFLSFLVRPWRLARNLVDFLVNGLENTRYMRMFNEILFNRRKWLRKKHTFETA